MTSFSYYRLSHGVPGGFVRKRFEKICQITKGIVRFISKQHKLFSGPKNKFLFEVSQLVHFTKLFTGSHYFVGTDLRKTKISYERIRFCEVKKKLVREISIPIDRYLYLKIPPKSKFDLEDVVVEIPV